MRQVIWATFFSALIFAVGCSGSSSVPTQPDTTTFPDAVSSPSDAKLLYSGTFDIDVDNLTITQSNSRQSEVVYDITGFLPDKCPGGCFRFTIVDVIGTVLEIELTIENPLAIQAYDVTIEYIELFGKSVLNPDSYTDFLGTPITAFYPFTAFMKESAERAFPIGPGGIDTETLFLDFPPGSPSSVHYAITASLPDQIGAPYEISEMAQDGELTSSGGSAEISCKVDDHQDDVSAVFLDSIPFTGGPVQMLPDPFNPGYYKVEISNTAGAPLGEYMQGIMALSPNPQNISTYNYVDITVTDGNEDPVAILAPDPANGCAGGSIWFDGSASYDTDGTIETYEFDFDYDGMNFVADVSGTQHRVQSPPYSEGTYLAALKVIDNLGAWDIDSVDVIIEPGGEFNVDPYPKIYVTDTSFSNIIFTPNGFMPDATQNWQLGLEAMAVGSEYIFAVFCASGTEGEGVYLTRSGDDGATWGDYRFIQALTTGWKHSGVAIDVIGSEVFIAFGESNTPNGFGLYLAYNDNNGEGDFSVIQISNEHAFGGISVVADPVDTDNIYVSVGQYTYCEHYEHIFIYYSNNGPDGPFNVTQVDVFFKVDYNRYDQVYTTELKVASDQDVYLFLNTNTGIELFKSDDFGATFTQIYFRQYDPAGSWARESDSCFDPHNPEIIHWVSTYRNPSQYRHVYRRSTNGGVSWSIKQNNLGGNLQGYTNVAICTDSAGNIYIVYTDKSSGNGEVYGRFSNDGGSSFGPVIQISDDPLNDGHVEITTTTNGCDVVIGWLEDRDGARRVVSRRG